MLITVRRATRRGSSAEQCDSMVGLWVIIHYTHLHAAHDFSICSSMTHASLFVSALSRRRRWPSRASRPLVPLYIYVYIRLRANSASRIANRGAAFGMGIPFPLSFDRRGTTPRHAGRATFTGLLYYTRGRGCWGFPRLAPVSPLFKRSERVRQRTHFFAYTDGCALSPSGGRRTRH